jgi:hypothetical protein
MAPAATCVAASSGPGTALKGKQERPRGGREEQRTDGVRRRPSGSVQEEHHEAGHLCRPAPSGQLDGGLLSLRERHTGPVWYPITVPTARGRVYWIARRGPRSPLAAGVFS